MIEQFKGKVRLYCAGGAGINIGKHLESFRGVSETGVAELHSVFVDTSRSNLSTNLPEEATYLLKDLDGSGKIRKENHAQIAAHTRDILQQHPPLDLNIVISSGSGGSGSVIAPSLVSELLVRDVQTIAITIGATDTRLEIDNTLKTLKSYEAIAKLRKVPVVMAYFQNSEATPRASVDEEVLRTITALLTVYSRENSELDSRDLYNFLHFERVTSYEPQLAALTLQMSASLEGDGSSVVTVASLYNGQQTNALPFIPDYQCVGYLPEGIAERIAEISPIHLATTSNLMPVVAKSLGKTLDELEQKRLARVKTSSILSDKDEATDSGLVL